MALPRNRELHITGTWKRLTEELSTYLEELLDDVEPFHEAVAALEDEVLLEVPRLRFLVPLEVGRQFRLELPEGRPVLAEHLQRYQHLVQGFLHFDLEVLYMTYQLSYPTRLPKHPSTLTNVYHINDTACM